LREYVPRKTPYAVQGLSKGHYQPILDAVMLFKTVIAGVIAAVLAGGVV
jgi:hypothetical protein